MATRTNAQKSKIVPNLKYTGSTFQLVDLQFDEVFSAASDKNHERNWKTLDLINRFVRKYLSHTGSTEDISGGWKALVQFAITLRFYPKTLQNLVNRRMKVTRHVFLVDTFSRLGSRKTLIHMGVCIQGLNMDRLIESIEITKFSRLIHATRAQIDPELFTEIHSKSTDKMEYGSTSEINASSRFTAFLNHFITGINNQGKVMYILGDQLPHGHRNRGAGNGPIEVQHTSDDDICYHTFLSGTLDYVFASINVDYKVTGPRDKLLGVINKKWSAYVHNVPRKVKLPIFIDYVQKGSKVFLGEGVNLEWASWNIFPIELKAMNLRFTFEEDSDDIIVAAEVSSSGTNSKSEDPSAPTSTTGASVDEVVDMGGSLPDDSKPQERMFKPGHILLNQDLWDNIRNDLKTLSPGTCLSPLVIDHYLLLTASRIPNGSISYIPYNILNGPLLDENCNHYAPTNGDSQIAIGVIGHTSPNSPHDTNYHVIVAIRATHDIYVLGQNCLSKGERGNVSHLVGYGGVTEDSKREELRNQTQTLWNKIRIFQGWMETAQGEFAKYRSTDWFQDGCDSGVNACEVVRVILETGFQVTAIGRCWELPWEFFPCAHEIRWRIYITIKDGEINAAKCAVNTNWVQKAMLEGANNINFYHHHFKNHICNVCSVEEEHVTALLLNNDDSSDTDDMDGHNVVEEDRNHCEIKTAKLGDETRNLGSTRKENTTEKEDGDEADYREVVEDVVTHPCLDDDEDDPKEEAPSPDSPEPTKATGNSARSFSLGKNVHQVIGECLAIYYDPDLEKPESKFMKFLVSNSNEWLWGIIDCSGNTHKTYITNTLTIKQRVDIQTLVFMMQVWVMLTPDQIFEQFEKAAEKQSAKKKE